MAENVVVKTEHKRVRFIRYDSGETLFIVKGANRKRSYMTGDNPTVKKLLASACEGEKIPIKAGIIRKLTTDDVKSFVSDNPDLSFGFWALVRLLEQYGNNNTQAEILRLISYLLMGYTSRMFLEIRPDLKSLMCSRAPVVYVVPDQTNFFGGFEHLSRIVRCLSIDTCRGGKLEHHVPRVLPGLQNERSIIDCAYCFLHKKPELGVFPAQYRDTSVLIHAAFFEPKDIQSFIRRNPWATVLLFTSKKERSEEHFSPTVELKKMSLADQDWDTPNCQDDDDTIHSMVEDFIQWLSVLHHHKEKHSRINHWIETGVSTISDYNFATVHTKQKLLQGSAKNYAWLQIATLCVFLDFLKEKAAIDDETQEHFQRIWFNTLYPGCQKEDDSQYASHTEKQKEEDTPDQIQLFIDVVKDFMESASEKMISPRNIVAWSKEYLQKSYKERVCITVAEYKPRSKIKEPSFPAVLLIKDDLVEFCKEKSDKSRDAVEDIWKKLPKIAPELPTFITKSRKIALPNKITQDGFVLNLQEMHFLDEELRNDLVEMTKPVS